MTQPSTHPHDALASALHTRDPAGGSELRLFGQFIGSWDLHWTAVDEAGEPIEAFGELHFGWVLGGRAVQDVWMVPGPDDPSAADRPRPFHGSTIRFYDSTIGAWRSTWIEPVNARVRKFIGRPRGDEIELVSLDGDPLLRWRFTKILPDSFTWLGECSTDEGRSWQLEEQMVATRRPGAQLT